jgi:hypothetical protein
VLTLVAGAAYLLFGVAQTAYLTTLGPVMQLLFGLIGAIAGLVGVVVGIFAAANRSLPMSLRLLPLLLSGLTVFFGLFNAALQSMVPIVIGILFIVFARNAKDRIEAASRS